MVTQALYPDVVGGSPIVVHQLAERLVQRGVDVEVHTADYGGTHDTAAYEVERHRRVPMPWDAIGTAGNPWTPRLPRAVARSAADVVHLHSHLFFTSVLGAKGAGRRPVVLTVHGVRAVRGPLVNLLQEAWLRTLGRKLLRRADAVICLNQRDAEEVQRYGAAPGRIHVWGNGYDSSVFVPGTGRRERNILWVGRMVPEKGLDVLVQAFAGVAEQVPDVRLDLVGDGPERAGLQALAARLGVDSKVRWHGALAQPDVAALMQRCGVFAFPSVREGFPVALAEAMGSACPIVASDGLAEILGDCGRVVPQADVEAWATALVSLLRDSDAATRLGQAARARAAKDFTLQAVADRHIGLYHRLTSAPR